MQFAVCTGLGSLGRLSLLLVCFALLATQLTVEAATPNGMPRGKSPSVCIHDKVAWDHLPSIQTGGTLNQKQKRTAGFSPIRITPHFVEPLDSAFHDNLTNPDGPLMKVLELLSNTLSVRPIQGNLRIPPECDVWTSGTNEGKCRTLHSATDCGIFTVPSQYVGTREICSTSNGSCSESGPNGTGAANTDFLLFVGAQNDYNCEFGPIAFAASCAMDDWYRPSAGYINLCTSNLVRNTDAETISDVLFNLILHEISHALGFSRFQFENFHDGNLNFYRPDTSGIYDGSTITALNSSKVLEVGRSYFGCSNLPYVPLENNGGSDSASSHWEARVLHHETMAPFLSNDYAVFSNFTLAFFEDSGWYQVNYTYVNNFEQFELQWGKGLGCEFVMESCENPNTYPYLCDESIIHQCTFDRISRGSCKSTYIYFDGCPIVVADDDTSCLHEANTPVPNNQSEVYGDDSICIELSMTEEDCLPTGGTPRCYQRQVVREAGTDRLAFSVAIDNSTYWCHDSEILQTEHGFLFCPSDDEFLLRVSNSDIMPVATLPSPMNVVTYSTYNTSRSGDGLSGDGSSSELPDNVTMLESCESHDEGCTHGDVRLVNGLNRYEGRVEVCKNDEWGTVCDNWWGVQDARVVCRQLGYDTYGAQALSYAYFGQGSGEIFLTSVGCRGTEERLLDCYYRSPNYYYYYRCGHYEDAGVRCPGPCQHGSVRLVNGLSGSRTRGTVEICNEGTWGTLCANQWDSTDATVLCVESGYSPYGAIASVDVFPRTASTYISSPILCSGAESNIAECFHSLQFFTRDGLRTVDTCAQFGSASVICHDVNLPNASCTGNDIRLVGGYIESEGRVEICINNLWGTVCDDGWDNSDASVVCRQLGYYSIGIAKSYAFFGRGRGPVLIEDVGCSGLEASLLDCDSSGLGLARCGHYEDAGVICNVTPPVELIPCTLGDIRLVNGSSELEGRVEICYGDIWGTICGSSWDNRDAGVVCKQLFNSSFGGLALKEAAFESAFGSGETTVGPGESAFGTGDGTIVISNGLNCDGTEDTLAECSVMNYGTCSPSNIAGIRCNAPMENTSASCEDGEVRLANGFSEYEGRVEICYNDTWGTVCSNRYSWGAEEATVICRQLGHISVGATAFSNSYYGVGYHSQLLQVYYCSGNEDNILECSRPVVGAQPSCSHTQEVGVKCLAPGNECTDGDVRLVGGSNEYEGRVEVCFYGLWGTVCHNSWDYLDAATVCGQLGYDSLGAIAHRYASSMYGRGTGPIWMTSVQCLANETSLINCSYSVSPSSLRYCNNHYYDAGVQCPVPSNDTCSVNGDIRLVNGPNELEGRVEVCYDHQWGTVCSRSFSTPEAVVVCRQLGHTPVGATAKTYSRSYSTYGGGTGGIYLNNLYCSGSEERLIDCRHNGIGVHNCDHTDDAGVVCQPIGNCTNGEVQLFGRSSEREGTVQICIDGVLGTICTTSWDSREADVVCSQLGFPTFGAIPHLSGYYRRNLDLPNILDDLRCIGTEDSLLNCTHDGIGIISYYCDRYHGDDARVECPVPVVGTCTNGDIRLVGGYNDLEGGVEICYNNQWGAVCDDYWNSEEARVACRQLGHSSFFGASYFSNSYFGYSTGGIFLDSVSCSGSESRLIDCRHDGIGVHNCRHSDEVGVRCQERRHDCIHGEVRLVNGLTAREGRVEICAEGTWGTVCDSGWDVNDARVVCRQLGFSTLGSQALSRAQFGRGSGPIMLSYLRCRGEEASLFNCSYSLSVSYRRYCSHSRDAGVRCPVPVVTNITCTNGELRLMGGSTPREGRVEMCYENQWGTVCDRSNDWNTNEAKVACRQLGFTSYGARFFRNSYFGNGTGPVLLDTFGCNGRESRLIDCSHSGVGNHYCDVYHSDDVGVRCIERGNCTEGAIRLVGGSSSNEGRVEICIEGLWGTICDSYWNGRDAYVVCRQLGFGPSVEGIPFTDSHFGEGSGPTWLSQVSCTGNENNLLDCSHRGIGVVNYYCQYNNYHYSDVGIRCTCPGSLGSGRSNSSGAGSGSNSSSGVGSGSNSSSGVGSGSSSSSGIGSGNDIESCRNNFGSGSGFGNDTEEETPTTSPSPTLRPTSSSTILPTSQSPQPTLQPTVAPIEGATVTVVLKIDGVTSPTVEDIEEIVQLLESFILRFCDREECEYLDDVSTGETKRSRFTKDTGVEIHVVSLTITEDGTIELTFFVTTPEGVLSGSSLQQIIEEAAQPDGLLSQHGVAVLDIEGPTTESTEESSNNSKSIVIGVVVGITGCVILVGAVGFFIWILKRHQKRSYDIRTNGHAKENTYGFGNKSECIETMDNHTVEVVAFANDPAEAKGMQEMEPQSVIPNEDTSSDNTSCEMHDE